MTAIERYGADLYIEDNIQILAVAVGGGLGASKLTLDYLSRKIDEGTKLKYKLVNSDPFPQRKEKLDEINKIVMEYIKIRQERFGPEMVKNATGV